MLHVLPSLHTEQNGVLPLGENTSDTDDLLLHEKCTTMCRSDPDYRQCPEYKNVQEALSLYFGINKNSDCLEPPQLNTGV